MPLTVQRNENDSSNLPEIGDVIIITFNRLCSKVYERLYRSTKVFHSSVSIKKMQEFFSRLHKANTIFDIFFIIILDNGLARLAHVILQ